MELVCIVCPNSCRLTVNEVNGELKVEGARCPRGDKFAVNETKNPTRSVTSSVKTTVKNFPVVSVKTNGEIPKGKMMELMKMLNEVSLDKAVPSGFVVLKNVFDCGVDVVTTTSMVD